MDKIAKCRYCGKEFVKNVKIHRFCSDVCRRRAYNEKPKAEEPKVTKVKVSMEQMLDAMFRLSEKKGRNVQYGEVQSLLIAGKLKVKGGVIYV